MSPFVKPLIRNFLFWMVAFTAVYFLVIILAAGEMDSVSSDGGVLLIQLLALLPFVWLFGMQFTGRLNAGFFFRGTIKPLTWWRLIMIWLSLLAVSYGLEGLTNVAIVRFYPAYAQELFDEKILDNNFSTGHNVLNILLAIVVGPVMEEIVFRGLLLQRLTIKYGSSAAILSSSFLFGILHFEICISAALFGFVMCLVFLASKNLWVPIILHVGNNVVSVVLSMLPQPYPREEMIGYLYDQFWYYLAALFVLPGLYVLLKSLWPAKRIEIPYDYNLNHAS